MKRSFFAVDILFSGCTVSVLFSADFLGNCITADPHRHKHTKYELHYVEEGNLTLETEKTRLSCPRGHILIIPPSVEHLLYYTPQTKTRTFLFAIGKSEGAKSALLSAIFSKEPLLVKDSFGGLARLLSIKALFESEALGAEEHVRGEVTHFFADLSVAGLCGGQRQEPFFKENREEEIDAYISRYCLSPDCSCEGLAKHLNLSKRQTHRICIDYYGAPFRTLLYRTRMQIAKYRLEHLHVSVSELALQLGYSSSSAFSSAYKRYFGKAPTDKK